MTGEGTRRGAGGRGRRRGGRRAALAAALLAAALVAPRASAAEVIVVGDLQYRPVVDVVAALRAALPAPPRVVATEDVRGRLEDVVGRERARVVVALGRTAVDEAVRLSPPTTVVFGLVIVPPPVAAPNVTGVYMGTPVGEYVSAVRRYLPSIKRVSVIGTRELLGTLHRDEADGVAAYRVASAAELVGTLDALDDPGAVLLLPDVALITSSVMERAYLFSFRRNVPLLGISEGNVRQGSLFALVFDPGVLGRQLAERAVDALAGKPATAMPPAPPRAFDLCLNVETARRLGISVPAQMLRDARRTYP